MKICSNCKEEVEDNFDMCWNCQYSFSASKVLKCSEFNVVCPACYAEIDRKLRFCPYCKFDLTKNSEIGRPKIPGTVKKIDCLRCQVLMSYNGNFRFHEGMHMGVFGDLFELFENRESFDLYYCPQCGKIEFFLPEIE